jgi:hypothetical protein
VDQPWISSGSAVDQQWIRRGSGVDQLWISCGSAVDQLWISCGSAVDQLWISCGSAVDQLWISIGPGCVRSSAAEERTNKDARAHGGPDEGAYSADSEVIKYMSLGVLPQETQAAILCLLEQRDRQRMAQASRVLKDAVQTYHLVDARVYYNDAPDHVWQDEQVLMYVRSGRAVRDRITRYSPRRPGYATIGWGERIDSLKRKTFAGYTFRHVEPTVHQCHPQ